MRLMRRCFIVALSSGVLIAHAGVALADWPAIWRIEDAGNWGAGRSPLMWLILGILALAFVIEGARRYRQHVAHLREQWLAVRRIAEERELSGKEWNLLQSILRRYAPRNPLQGITAYRTFDACVSRDIQEQARSRDAQAVEARGAALRELRIRLGLDYVPFGLQIESTRELCVGQILWAARDAASPQWRRMRVASVDEARFRTDVAPEDARPDFAAGELLRFRMWRDEDARYVFTTRLTRIDESANQWIFEHTQELKRVQARAHYRIRFDQTASFALLQAREDDDYADLEQRPVIAVLRGRITSLSGGGLAVILEESPPSSAVLRAALELDENPPIEIYARIVNVSPLMRGRHLARAAFVGISEETREAITRFVFHQQQLRAAETGGEGTAE